MHFWDGFQVVVKDPFCCKLATEQMRSEDRSLGRIDKARNPCKFLVHLANERTCDLAEVDSVWSASRDLSRNADGSWKHWPSSQDGSRILVIREFVHINHEVSRNVRKSGLANEGGFFATVLNGPVRLVSRRKKDPGLDLHAIEKACKFNLILNELTDILCDFVAMIVVKSPRVQVGIFWTVALVDNAAAGEALNSEIASILIGNFDDVVSAVLLPE
ncbi:hypothetical protein AB0K02_26740 [Streptomyces sp. NPDC049597]|uniref:hypothetical protein n=1 Tax=Streptomyces sp. NPDC049597 TaxID=3155276 RepID=UPI003423E3F8